MEAAVQGGPGGRVMLGQHELQQELAQGDFGEQVLAIHHHHHHHHHRHHHHHHHNHNHRHHHRHQVMAWRGLQALSGGTLADMFPPMDRGMGMGMGGGQVREKEQQEEKIKGMKTFSKQKSHVSKPVQAGFNNFTMAMAQAAQAQQAQENMMRLQQQQQQQQQQVGEVGGAGREAGPPGAGCGVTPAAGRRVRAAFQAVWRGRPVRAVPAQGVPAAAPQPGDGQALPGEGAGGN